MQKRVAALASYTDCIYRRDREEEGGSAYIGKLFPDILEQLDATEKVPEE